MHFPLFLILLSFFVFWCLLVSVCLHLQYCILCHYYKISPWGYHWVYISYVNLITLYFKLIRIWPQ